MQEHPPAASLALALAILAVPLAVMPVLGGPLGLIALAIAGWSLRRQRAEPERFHPSGLVTAAKVVALVAIGLAVLMLPFWLVIATAMAAHQPTTAPLLF